MKFFCEYCGCRIDSEKDTKCPNCGASYKKNAAFLKHEEEIKREEIKNKDELEKNEKVVKSATNVIFIIAISIILLGFITMIISMIGFGKIGKKVANEISDTIESSINNQEEKITVGINEYAKTSKYQVKVTGYDVADDFWYHPKEGYEYITFHIVVENLYEKSITREEVNCIVSGIAQTNEISSGYSSLPFYIQRDLAVTGDATFEVPIDAKSYDIRYGDHITIHIDKE